MSVGTRTDFVPRGDVLIRRANGTVVERYSSSTAADRGADLLAAKAKAVSGDTIEVGPGTYSVNGNLLKNGVNWHFVDSVVTRNDTGDGSLFDDYTSGANGACTSVVSGTGTFIRDSDTNGSDLCCVVLLTNPASDLTIHALDLKDAGEYDAAAVRSVVRHAGGALAMNCRDILSPNAFGIWWSDGPAFITCNQLISGPIAIYLSARTDTLATGPGSFPGSPSNLWTGGEDNYFWIKANLIQTTTADVSGDGCILTNTDGEVATQAIRVWIDALEIRGYDFYKTISLSNYRNYLRAMKISSQNPSSSFVIEQSSKALIWLDCQKLEGGNAGTIDVSGGVGDYRIGEIGDGGVGEGAALIRVRSNGYLDLHSSKITKTTTGPAIQVINGSISQLNLGSGRITTVDGEMDLFQSGTGRLHIDPSAVKYDTAKVTGTVTYFNAAAMSKALATIASTVRSDLGLVIGTNVQAYDADLTTWAGLTPSANAQSLVTAADYSAMRTLLDVEAGTDFPAYRAELDKFNATAVTVASATTPNIAGAASDVIDISGTTGISGFTTSTDGVTRKVRFTGALTLTHSSSLRLPGAANITTAANDTAVFRCTGTTNWICTDYQRANGDPVKVVNVDQGGTGATTFTANRVLAGNGTSAVFAATGVSVDGTGLVCARLIITGAAQFDAPGANLCNFRDGSNTTVWVTGTHASWNGIAIGSGRWFAFTSGTDPAGTTVDTAARRSAAGVWEFISVSSGTPGTAGKVCAVGGIMAGTTSLNSKAILQADSTTLVFMPPGMTTTQRDNISSPPERSVVFNTTTHKLNLYSGSGWEAVTSA